MSNLCTVKLEGASRLDPHFAFNTAGGIAMLGWLGLLMSLFVPATRDTAKMAARLAIPALLGVAYVVLIAQGWGKAPSGGVGSIEQVPPLFSGGAGPAARRLHFLAFVFFVGGL